jgi:hypothetical protein
MKHIKKHPVNDKLSNLSKDMKKQDHVKPVANKKLDADKSLSDADVSMKVTKPSNKKLDGEKFLADPTVNTKKPSKPSNKKLDGEKFLSESLNHLKKFNENIDDDFDMASSHLDSDSIEYHKNEKRKIKNILEGVLDDISSDLEEFTNAVSGEININDTLYSSFGDYEYQIKIKRIS